MKTYKKILLLVSMLSFIMMVGCQDDEVLQPTSELHAVAGEDRTAHTNEEIELDGSASHDKANKPFAYLWSVKVKPAGATVILGSVHTAKTSFVTDKPGTYLVELQISQGSLASADQMMITVSSDVNTPASVILHEDIDNDMVLEDIIADLAQADYILSENITVRGNLTIKPGVTIVVQQGKGIDVVGSIRAIGTAGKDVVIKGMVDEPGYWRGIMVHSNSALNELGFMSIRNGGAARLETSSRANIIVAGTTYSGAALKLYNSFLSSSEGYGLYVEGMAQINSINNTFNDNTTAAYIPAGQLRNVYDNILDGNENNVIETGGEISSQGEAVWKRMTTGAYLVSDNVTIRSGVSLEPGAMLRIKPNVTIRVNDNGFLKAIGTETAKVIFTAVEGQGRWNGLLFNSANSNNRLEYAEISKAGNSKMSGASHPANVALGNEGSLEIRNSTIANSPGYGIAAHRADQLNSDAISSNAFANVALGKVYPTDVGAPAKPPVTGLWLDWWSFVRGSTTLSENFYNQQSGVWFEGAARPRDMTAPGFGILIDASNQFTWTVAENSPWTGCVSYSAEYMIGKVTITPTTISFDQEYWRSKFINSCDATQNVDVSVETSIVELPYEINWLSDASQQPYWELKFKNPDGSTFSYYRR